MPTMNNPMSQPNPNSPSALGVSLGINNPMNVGTILYQTPNKEGSNAISQATDGYEVMLDHLLNDNVMTGEVAGSVLDYWLECEKRNGSKYASVYHRFNIDKLIVWINENFPDLKGLPIDWIARVLGKSQEKTETGELND